MVHLILLSAIALSLLVGCVIPGDPGYSGRRPTQLPQRPGYSGQRPGYATQLPDWIPVPSDHTSQLPDRAPIGSNGGIGYSRGLDDGPQVF